MRPEGAQRFFIARTLGVKAGQHDEQRGRIDATVIEAERHFVERGHLSTAHLVQNLPWLGVQLGILPRRLISGQPTKHAARQRGLAPQQLHRGDEAIAAERRGVPGDAGIGIMPLRRHRDEHVEIGRRTTENFIENVIRRFDRRNVARLLLAVAKPRAHRLEERGRSLGAVQAAGHCAEHRHMLVGLQPDCVGRNIVSEHGGRRIEDETRATQLAVKALVIEFDRRAAVELDALLAAASRRIPRTSNRSKKSLAKKNEKVSSTLCSPKLRTPRR